MNYLSVIIWTLMFIFQLVKGSDVLYIQHAPNYYQISKDVKDAAPLKSSQFPDVVLAALGFSIRKDFRWDGIKSSTFFQRPEAVVVVEFVGFENVNSEIAVRGFPLTVDVEPSSAYAVLAQGINARYPNSKVMTLDVTNDDNFYSLVEDYSDLLEGIDTDPDRLSATKSINNKPLKSLNVSNNADKDFLTEMRLFDDVAEALVAKYDKVRLYKAVDLIWMQSTAMKKLVKTYGAASPQVAEATNIIKEFLKKLETRLTKLYEDNYLMLVLTVDIQNEGPKSRIGRSLLVESELIANASDINVSPSYDEDYPAMFNIIFFVSLLLSLTVFAIALGMWYIDPGRDSIIYRMTSQRMKKDQ